MKSELRRLSDEQKFLEKSGYFNGERFIHYLNKRAGNRRIHELLSSNEPVMIGRHGTTELSVAVNYDIELELGNIDELCFNSGFFPNDSQLGENWAELYLKSSENIDCLCDWNYRYGKYNEIRHIMSKYSPQAAIVNQLEVLSPFSLDQPWTRALQGKRVLVIHPFSETIKSQYEKRALLFKNPEVLPEFKSLDTIRAVQTITGNIDPRFKTWFDAYQHMRNEISQYDFDIALIGCGSYGLILAADIKKLGKQSIHMGGCLQLLFGIRGHRWDSNQGWRDSGIFNQHWVRASETETPENATGMEGGAYW